MPPGRSRYSTRFQVPPARFRTGTRLLRDCSETFVYAEDWLGSDGSDAKSSSELRAESLLRANHGILRDYDIDGIVGRRGKQPGVLFRTSTRIGALPLLSPVTGQPDFGLVIEPRFQWSSAGDMFAGMGFRVVPDLLPLPQLPQSERRVPPWVLSSIVLGRMRQLLDNLQRRFDFVVHDCPAPKGQVQWGSYATTRLSFGQALKLPCRYPDLRDDEDLRGSIQWVIRRHRESLSSQVAEGLVVRLLIDDCDDLLNRLRGTLPRVPTANMRERMKRSMIQTRVFSEGLQAIEWTAEERGLAGFSDLTGLAWRMDMEKFFEAWVEAIAETAARKVGAILRADRKNQTQVPLDWTPPSLGSQRSLRPDFVLQRDDVVVVIDAKYKRHAEEIERIGWHDADATTKEQHRNDVLQALAYAALFDTPRVVACLAYPASHQSWQGLVDRNRTMSRASVRTGKRNVELALIAVPLSGERTGPAHLIERLFREDAAQAAEVSRA